jgi:hypothetical protein
VVGDDASWVNGDVIDSAVRKRNNQIKRVAMFVSWSPYMLDQIK